MLLWSVFSVKYCYVTIVFIELFEFLCINYEIG